MKANTAVHVSIIEAVATGSGCGHGKWRHSISTSSPNKQAGVFLWDLSILDVWGFFKDRSSVPTCRILLAV